MKMLGVWAALVLCVGSLGVVWAQDAPVAVAPAATSDADLEHSSWAVDLGKRHAELVARNGPGKDAALRARLLRMRDEDQAAPERGLVKVDPKNIDAYRKALNLHATDTRLTAELKAVVAKNGWPTIAMVGYDASNAAMLILTHTRDHVWQRSMLPRLENLASEGKIDGSALATVVDKELVSEGKLQRYGTQFKVMGGKMAMFAVEDREGLDARRAVVFLMPMDAYEHLLSEMYHLPVSAEVASAK
jgi:hypothetical protein